jgi:hypothetical protein
MRVVPACLRALESASCRILKTAVSTTGGRRTASEVLHELDGPARVPRDLVEALARGVRQAARVDGQRPERGQDAAGLGDSQPEPIGGDGRLARGPPRVARPEIGSGIQVLLGADDQLGHAVVNVVRHTPALVVLGGDDLLDQRGEGALPLGLLAPGPERDAGRGDDQEHLERVDHEREGKP